MKLFGLPGSQFERVIFIVVVVGVLLWLSPVLLGPFYIEYRFKPSRPDITQGQIEAETGVRLEAYRVTRQGLTRTYAVGPLLMWAVPSGPPIYVFDDRGKLLDYTLDAGDDQRFSETWILDSDLERVRKLPPERR